MKKILFCFIIFLNTIFAFSQVLPVDSIRKYYLLSDYQEIINIYNDFKSDSNFTNQHYYYAALAFKENYQFKNGLEAINYALRIDSLNIKFLKVKAKLFFVQNDFNNSLSIYENIFKNDTNNLSVMVNMAKLYQLNKQYYKAIDFYSLLIKTDSLNAYYNKQLGMCLINTKNLFEAIYFLEKSIESNPKDIGVVSKMVNICNELKYYDKALNVINLAINNNQNSKGLLKLRGYTYYLQKNYKLALKDFEQVNKLQDTSLFSLKYLALSCYNTDNFEMAYSYFKKVIVIDPNNSSFYFYLSITARKIYKTQESINYIDKSLELLYPSNKTLSSYYRQMAENYITHGARKKIKEKYVEEKESYQLAADYYLKSYIIDTLNPFGLLQTATTYDSYLQEKSKALAYYYSYKDKLSIRDEESEAQYQRRLEYLNNRISRIREELHFESSLE